VRRELRSRLLIHLCMLIASALGCLPRTLLNLVAAAVLLGSFVSVAHDALQARMMTSEACIVNTDVVSS
jgi:hypothetical protein